MYLVYQKTLSGFLLASNVSFGNVSFAFLLRFFHVSFTFFSRFILHTPNNVSLGFPAFLSRFFWSQVLQIDHISCIIWSAV